MGSEMCIRDRTWRLAHSLKSFLVQLYDVRTAFPQMGWDELFEEVSNSDTTNYAGKRMENTHRRMRVYMNTSDGVICLRRKRGVREGATDGPGLFTRGYAKPMREFERELRAVDRGQRILLRYDEQNHDLSLGDAQWAHGPKRPTGHTWLRAIFGYSWPTAKGNRPKVIFGSGP